MPRGRVLLFALINTITSQLIIRGDEIKFHLKKKMKAEAKMARSLRIKKPIQSDPVIFG